ncbi:flippase [Metallibacterium sp.]|uniref:flippase n=1 Tax=Metallibacterium sp. TaxID=2940281 RepID=UPI00262CC1A3|nr:flippase [Metallibacterium sp.]
MSRKVAHNALWNVGGQLVSLGVGLVALPILLHALGAARLGVFTLALGLIGFSGLFDLGLSRALTQTVSSSLGMGRSRAQVAALVWRVIGLLAGFGVFWLVALWWAAPFLVDRLFSLSGEMARETIFGLRALALSIPFALAATGAMGTLEGLQQFRLLSLWRMPMSVLQFGLPVLVALIRPDVGWVIAALAVTRVVWMLLWLTQLHRLLPREPGVTSSRADLRHALHFGGWLSVSNLIGPLMVYADRFYLASLFPPAMVAYYTVPFDTAYRATSLPQTAMNALFPALAETQTRPGDSVRLLALAMRAVVVLVLPAVLVVAVFAHPLLALWLNVHFAGPATPVLQLLLIGIFLNSAAHLPYALLQAHGRSDLTAKLHLLELPVFAVLLVVGVHWFGITGAALAWTLRVALDAALLYAAAWWLQQPLRRVLAKGIGLLCLATGALVLVVYVLRDALQLVSTSVLVAACAYIALRVLWLTRPGTRKEVAP